MRLILINNPDTSAGLAYKIARVAYAQSGGRSLAGVEAIISMIKNISEKSGLDIEHIITDKNIFEALSENSPRHAMLGVCPNNRAFQMCLRVARRMLRGGLNDGCFGATRFHYANQMPDWARARGYIADIDDMLFYL